MFIILVSKARKLKQLQVKALPQDYISSIPQIKITI